jgi:glycosyltransferase involved in cell wall biosynthesis
MPSDTLVCLLPVRNGEADLPGYLESVARFADAVVALDDGSTDHTRAILDASPLVKRVLENPPRRDYRGWDDTANRNRLLEAAADLEPECIFSLDADERIPPDDAAALRSFVEREALPGLAFGFKVYRMWRDLGQYDRAGLWVYRLFSFEPGQRCPDQRLHFVPIPTSIPRECWVRTTIRIQHLAGLTEERRLARFEKYRQADPGNAFQHSYRDLLEPPADLFAWEARPEGLAVLDVSDDEVASILEDAGHPSLDEIVGRPALSAVVISRDDGARLLRAVASVVAQESPWPFEVIVVASGEGNGAAMVRERFPSVNVVELPRPALPGEARNAGLRLARGEYVSFPGSHVELPPGSLAGRMRAHDRGYAMVTGTTLNGTRTWAGWASYFLDHSAVLPGRPSTELEGAPSHCSYRRGALLAVGGFPEHLRAGEDAVVNQELARRGYGAYRAQDVTLVHRSPCRTPWRLVRHHVVRGRGFGRILRERDGWGRRNLLGPSGLRFLRQQTVRRLSATTRNVRRWGDRRIRAQYLRAFPLVVAGTLAAAAGTWYELLRWAPGGPDPVAADPVVPRPTAGTGAIAEQGNGQAGDTEAGGLLPRHRIVAYYGNPRSAAMGVLGERDRATVLADLRDQAARYAAADPSRPVIPAFDVIAAVAQRDPGRDGKYRSRLSAAILDDWAEFAAREGVLLILDVQPGRSRCREEIERLRPWLWLPHVHLALDPEWAVGEDEVPGIHVGHLAASQIRGAQEALAALVESENLPPKLLVVHQFERSMIPDKEALAPDPGVQLVIDVDGNGAPTRKTTVYNELVPDEPVGFAGIMVFYKKDEPLLTADQVLALTPPPDLVVYQ